MQNVGGCNKYYDTPETEIGRPQNRIHSISVTYSSSSSYDCGGYCGSTDLDLEIFDGDSAIVSSQYSGSCFTPGTGGTVIFYPEINSVSTKAPTLRLHTTDLLSAAATIDWIRYDNYVKIDSISSISTSSYTHSGLSNYADQRYQITAVDLSLIHI